MPSDHIAFAFRPAQTHQGLSWDCRVHLAGPARVSAVSERWIGGRRQQPVTVPQPSVISPVRKLYFNWVLSARQRKMRKHGLAGTESTRDPTPVVGNDLLTAANPRPGAVLAPAKGFKDMRPQDALGARPASPHHSMRSGTTVPSLRAAAAEGCS